MHDSLFTVEPLGIRQLHTTVNWGGSPLYPSWICRVSTEANEPQPWGPLRVFDSEEYVVSCKRVATPFYSKGTLRTARLCKHYLKACNGCMTFFLTHHKWDGVCKGCSSAVFCSAECQRQSWGAHKVVCKRTKRATVVDKPLVELLADHLGSIDDKAYGSMLDAVTDADSVIKDLREVNRALMTRLKTK